VVSWIVALAVEFQTGGWIARRARDREIAVCAAFLMIQLTVMPIIGEVLFGGRRSAFLTNGPYDAAMSDASIMIVNLLSVTALLAGAVRVRRRVAEGVTG
jgi:hypothetical protein